MEEETEDLDDFGSSTVAGGSTKKWMHKLDVMKRVISSDLNPLKVCSANVVVQFARVAHATDFVYCYSILEANKRSDYGSTTTPSAQQNPYRLFLPVSANAELNTFFPFDPYKLPKSSPYIDGVYREWSSVAIADDEEEDEDVDEPAGEAIAQRAPSDESFTRGLGTSFEAMSISPARNILVS